MAETWQQDKKEFIVQGQKLEASQSLVVLVRIGETESSCLAKTESSHLAEIESNSTSKDRVNTLPTDRSDVLKSSQPAEFVLAQLYLGTRHWATLALVQAHLLKLWSKPICSSFGPSPSSVDISGATNLQMDNLVFYEDEHGRLTLLSIQDSGLQLGAIMVLNHRSNEVVNSSHKSSVFASDSSIFISNSADFDFNNAIFILIFGVDTSQFSLDTMDDTNKTLKELATPDVLCQPWCIQYPELEQALSYELKFHGLVCKDPHKHLKEFHVVCFTMRPHGILEDYIKMKTFSFSLDGAAKDCLYQQLALFNI
ncbi:hypothetical protein CR513_18811, partial [Mucuna pruriens]